MALWEPPGGRPLHSNLTGGKRRMLLAVIVLPLLPLVANSFGWIFTEMGRQPWVVFGQMKTAAGVSANSPAARYSPR